MPRKAISQPADLTIDPVYIVRRPFTYQGKPFKRGDAWDPAGGRYDDIIIRSGFVVLKKKEVSHAN